MESQIIWLSTIVFIAIIFIPYALKFRKREKMYHERRQEAIALGADKPVAQYPQIDILKCIGCATCVKACPEETVLGIVHGKSTVINGLKCVGHGRCAEVCPVNAITVGLGDISKRDDIPLMNDAQETNIPGIYIAGELGGLALIKNAISQGKQVVDHIAATINPGQKDRYDVLIIGAGPAGISAALSAKQHNLSYLVIDQQGFGGTILQYPRKKVVLTHPVEIPLYGWLKKHEYSKEELLAIWNEIRQKFNLQIKIGERLTFVQQGKDSFIVETNCASYPAQTVILALGRRGTPRKLGVPGEESAKVMYKLEDAESYQCNHILVVGGGDSAIEAATGLSMQPGNRVIISYRKNKFFRLKKKNQEVINRLIAERKVRVIYESNVQEIMEDAVHLSAVSGPTKLRNDYVLIFAGGIPPFKLLQDIGIAFGGETKNVAA